MRPRSSDRSTPQTGRFSDDELARAREDISAAINIMGLGSNRAGKFHCPDTSNHDSGVPKASFRRDGIWGCPKCRIGGDAIALLKDWGGYSFPDAVNLLLGRPTSGGLKPPAEIVVYEAEPEFTAVVDVDVYTTIVAAGSTARAEAFYGRFGISPESVRTLGATFVEDMAALHAELDRTYGRDRLVAAGVIKPDAGKRKDDYWLVNDRYPVIEPHKLPDGRVVGLQFRGSEQTEAKIRKARADKAAGRTNRDGSPLNIPPKFLSLRGAGRRSRVGLNLPHLAQVSASARAALTARGLDPDVAPPAGEETHAIWIVEGFKDVLAMHTMGYAAYGIPGTNFPPVRGVCDMLRPCLVKVALDGDAAGQKGRDALIKHLEAHGVRCEERIPPPGKDMCDILGERLGLTA